MSTTHYLKRLSGNHVPNQEETAMYLYNFNMVLKAKKLHFSAYQPI